LLDVFSQLRKFEFNHCVWFLLKGLVASPEGAFLMTS
jgi:hypothetical protein